MEAVCAGYGHTEVLHGVDLSISEGEVVALIGANGAGKSTLLRAAVGLIAPKSGSVRLAGKDMRGVTPERFVTLGVALVPEGRLLFGPMTVRENLELGAYSAPRAGKSATVRARMAKVHHLFPVLSERADQPAETLSGGEQQMLAVGRALMSAPRLLLLDEPSLGLAPKVIAEIFSAIEVLRADRVTVLIVEQDARLALKHADRGSVMRTGEIVLEAPSADLLRDESVRKIYLGSWHEEGSEG
jgi:branched-chain amino acid transport system ATP-binding protein